MSSNFGLSSLPSLGSFIPSGSPSSSSADTPHTDSGPSIGSTILNGIAPGLGTAADVMTGGSGITVQRVVIVILGLLLIAAGIFAFKPVRETVIESAKTGAKAAAMA